MILILFDYANEFLWVEKYRPKTIADCILPDSIKQSFSDFLTKGEIPNLLLCGTSGVGKTTVARALCEELGCDYIIINGSDEGRFWTQYGIKQRTLLRPSLSNDAPHKVIIIDEADNTTHDVQLLLRANIGHFITTADSSSPATTRTKSLNLSTPDVQWSSSELSPKTNLQLQQSSSSVSGLFLRQRALNMIKKFSSNSSTNTSRLATSSQRVPKILCGWYD